MILTANSTQETTRISIKPANGRFVGKMTVGNDINVSRFYWQCPQPWFSCLRSTDNADCTSTPAWRLSSWQTRWHMYD